MKPVFKTTEETIEEIVNEKVKKVLEKGGQTGLQTGVQTGVGPENNTGNKISKILDDIKKRKLPDSNERMKTGSETGKKTDIEGSEKNQKKHEDLIDCPTCHGHMHGIGNGMTYRCTGKDCGKEVVVIPKDADYKCTRCSSPIKKPDEKKGEKIDGCPFCGNTKAIEFDWSKLKINE